MNKRKDRLWVRFVEMNRIKISDPGPEDHSNHGAPKELLNPCPEWIHRFL